MAENTHKSLDEVLHGVFAKVGAKAALRSVPYLHPLLASTEALAIWKAVSRG